MSSSPPRPTQNAPTRSPLQERTQSQTNELSSRIPHNGKTAAGPPQIYATSPFPTKPQHVLLPSTIRKQKSQRNIGLGSFKDPGHTSAQEVQSAPPIPRHPAVRLKKSVRTLRDMYEAQSDDSRPSTALSTPRSRPGSSSSKLRSFSSNEGLAGRFAWEQFKSLASDDTALLPSLPEDTSTLRQVDSQSSFAVQPAAFAATSSPNFRVIGGTSSPRNPQWSHFSSVLAEESSDPVDLDQSSSSSPNIMRFGRSSSLDELPVVEEASSPNFVKLGTSSPDRETIRQPVYMEAEYTPSDDPSSSPNFIKLGTSSPARTLRAEDLSSRRDRRGSASSDASQKRKRSDEDEISPLAGKSARVADSDISSSPPEGFEPSQTRESFSSSPPLAPIVRTKSVFMESPDAGSVLDAVATANYDQSSLADTHSELQVALSSSPAPPIHYPVIRAPASSQATGLSIHKRHNRSSITADSVTPRWPSRLSTAPSDNSQSQRDNSKRSSSLWEDTDEAIDSDDIIPEPYASDEEANASQIRIVPISERDEEADDEVMGLPGERYRYRANQMMGTSSYTHSPSSSLSRLNSLQSSVEYRLNSMSSRRPSLRRPSSSSSLASATVPTWAKRYYSGLYQDSFKYLMTSNSMVNVTQIVPQPQQDQPPLPTRPESVFTTSTSRTPKSSRRSFTSIRETLTEKLPALIRPRNRPRLEARKSHTMPGVGPLVSHPVRGPATAALLASKASQSSLRNARGGIRPVSFPLHPADPRAHWAGLTEDQDGVPPGSAHQNGVSAAYPRSGMAYTVPSRRMSRLPSISPHLHHDHRLNTGSTASRGYGHPFNRTSRYSNPSDMFFDGPETTEGKSRSWHAACFILGFVFAPAWVVGALLPLPTRPDAFADIEKGHWQRASIHGHVTDREAMQVLNRLRQEKRLRGGEELHWQNARWWRTLNRWMSVVGVVLLILVIVLAVVGTTRGLR